MKHFFTLILIVYSFISFAQIPTGYYNSANGLEGEDLREALRSIITSGHSQNSYDGLYSDYEDTDNYTNGKVWDMYSMHADGTANYWFTHYSDKCGSYVNEGDCYNREHSVPQSWFGSNQPMYADLFIVYPTDGKVNGWRSNYPFGETNSPSVTTTNGSKKGSCSFAGYTGTIFEPIDEFKGDFARTYFYVATRYKNSVGSWTGNADIVFVGDNLSTFAKNLFLHWNEIDPVSQKEIDRNNAVYPLQGNRNPYIDHPEWVECVWGTCSGLNFTSTPVTSVMVSQTYTYDITYNVDIDNEDISCTKPAWLTFSKDLANNSATLSGTPTDTEIGNHNITLTLNENGETKTQSFTIVVSPYNSEVVIFNKDFDDNSITSGGWTSQSITGSGQEWITSTHSGYTNGYYAKMSGYDGSSNNINEDWLISPAVNTDNYTSAILNFVTSMNEYGTDNTFNVFILEDYDGTSNPSTATQNDITSIVNLSPGSYTFTNSGDIDLSSYTGAIYLAFKYTSGTSNGRTWEVDDILLKGDVVEGIEQILNSIKIYPNPIEKTLFISSDKNISTLSIVDILGQTVNSFTNINSKNKEINLENLNNGIYIISIINIDGSNNVIKFIKK